jgi:hypothetical protein
MEDQVSSCTEAILAGQMDRLANAFGLSPEAAGRLVEIARQEIERDERFVNSDDAIRRAVTRARVRLLGRQDRLRSAR